MIDLVRQLTKKFHALEEDRLKSKAQKAGSKHTEFLKEIVHEFEKGLEEIGVYLWKREEIIQILGTPNPSQLGEIEGKLKELFPTTLEDLVEDWVQ